MSTACAPRVIEMTAEWRTNIATAMRTADVVIRTASDVMLAETSRCYSW
jgi:hypothetical protein